MNHILPVSPGEILREEFMRPLNLTQYKLAKAIGVSPIRVSQIVRTQRKITPDTALRLAYTFGNSARFWLNLQAQYDLAVEGEHFEYKGLDKLQTA